MSDNAEIRGQHWAKTRNLTIVVLIIWAIFSFLVPGYMVESLNKMSFLDFPLGYYFCVQGSLVIFVVLIYFQNKRQDAIDDEFGVGDE